MLLINFNEEALGKSVKFSWLTFIPKPIIKLLMKLPLTLVSFNIPQILVFPDIMSLGHFIFKFGTLKDFKVFNINKEKCIIKIN